MSPDNRFRDSIVAAVTRACGAIGGLNTCQRLTGGASMETWLLDFETQKLILRRLPGGLAKDDTSGRVSLDTEINVIKSAGSAGVKAPIILGELKPEDDLGEGFLMSFVSGEALPQKLFRDPNYASAIAGLTEDCATELAKIHAVPVDALPDDLPHLSTEDMIDALDAQYRAYGKEIPVFDLALYHLKTHKRPPSAPVLLHGDYRMGNFLIEKTGLSAVLDWELAHIGDPAQDIGYLCAPSWRFGRYDQQVGGFGDLAAFLEVYNARSGRSVTVADASYWMIYASLWWGLVCLSMIDIWRTGKDRTLERSVIGRRVSECEVDLLLMLENGTATAKQKTGWSLPVQASPVGITHAAELAEALGNWITQDVLPETKGRNLFQARVARNALGILQREGQYEETFRTDRAARLTSLGLTQRELCNTLGNGHITLDTPGVLDHLRRSVLEKLSIDQPKYAGLKTALERWTT